MAHPFYRRAWPGAGSVCLGYPLQHRPIPPVEVGRIYWRGTNASEFSYGYLLASGSQTSQIAAQAFKSFTSSGGGASSDLNPITIVIRSEGVRSAETVTLQTMYLLPPTPLAQALKTDGSAAQDINGLYLLTVVDPRFYWWNFPCPALNITSSTSWQTVLSNISASLGINNPPLTWDEPDPTLLFPHNALNQLQGEPIPLVLDTILYNIQARLVATTDGNYHLEGQETAYANRTLDDEGGTKRSYHAGGNIIPKGPGWGNKNIPPLQAILPQAVEFHFRPKLCHPSTTDAQNVTPVTYIVKEPITNFDAQYIGHPGAKLFRDLCTASFTGGQQQPDNYTQLLALVNGFVEEWIEWNNSVWYDRIYNGIVNFLPEGFNDTVEWTYRLRDYQNAGEDPFPSMGTSASPDPDKRKDENDEWGEYEITTRAYTKAYNWEPEQLHHLGTDCQIGACGPPQRRNPQKGGATLVCQTLYEPAICGNPGALVNTGLSSCCVLECCKSTSQSSSGGGCDPRCQICGVFLCPISVIVNCLRGGTQPCCPGLGLCCGPLNDVYIMYCSNPDANGHCDCVSHQTHVPNTAVMNWSNSLGGYVFTVTNGCTTATFLPDTTQAPCAAGVGCTSTGYIMMLRTDPTNPNDICLPGCQAGVAIAQVKC